MSKFLTDKTARIFFRAIGFLGIVAMFYKWFIDDLELSNNIALLTVVFAVFIWQPKKLLYYVDIVISKFKTK